MLCGRKKAQKSFPPKLNRRTLANCIDKYLNSQTETMESELPTCEFGYGKYLIVPFWYASAAYQARLVSPWVFWLDCVSLKYEIWLDQTRLICPAEAYQKGTITGMSIAKSSKCGRRNVSSRFGYRLVSHSLNSSNHILISFVIYFSTVAWQPRVYSPLGLHLK